MTVTAALQTNQEISLLHARYAVTRERHLRDELVGHYDSLAVDVVRRFPTWREDRADLVQVARIGLIHAVDRFDPDRQRPFPAFARATILGELKRYLRDHTWRVHVPRSLQEHYLAVVRAVDDLTQELRRPPQIAELGDRTGLTDGEVVEALDLARSLAVVSVEEAVPGGGSTRLVADDTAFGHVEDKQALGRALARLSERDREALRLRFEHELSQSEIAARLGVSQMSISRALARSVRQMRSRLREMER
jgi:RNA polymerase sigma-B factor